MRNKLAIICILCTLICLTGCGKSDSRVKVSSGSNESMIYIYYPDDKEIKKDEEMYQIKLPDSVSSSVEEVMTVLTNKLGTDVTYHTYMLDADNNLSLEFTAHEDLTREKALLTDAAICETLFQISEINDIDIKLSDDTGSVIRDNLYMRESFYFYGYSDADMNNRQIQLYYADKSGGRIISSTVTVIDEPNVSMEEKIVSQLVSRGSIPAKTTVNSVGISEGVCYLDLNSKFMNSVSNVSGEVALYSLVNSIVSLPDIDAVQIMIDGEVIHMYRGVSDVDVPLTFNSDILQ